LDASPAKIHHGRGASLGPLTTTLQWPASSKSVLLLAIRTNQTGSGDNAPGLGTTGDNNHAGTSRLPTLHILPENSDG